MNARAKNSRLPPGPVAKCRTDGCAGCAADEVRRNLPPARARGSCPCGADHSIETPGLFYVSVSDGARVAPIAGPYAEHAAALADVEDASIVATEEDPRAHFYAFGTFKIPRGADGSEYNKPGILNDKLIAYRKRAEEERAAVVAQAAKPPRKIRKREAVAAAPAAAVVEAPTLAVESITMRRS